MKNYQIFRDSVAKWPFLSLLNTYRVAQKKRSKSNFFINTEIMVYEIKSLDQSPIYIMSIRGLKDISINCRVFEKQTKMWDMVEIAVNRRPFHWSFTASTRFNLWHFASFFVMQSSFSYSCLKLEIIPHTFMKSRGS